MMESLEVTEEKKCGKRKNRMQDGRVGSEGRMQDGRLGRKQDAGWGGGK